MTSKSHQVVVVMAAYDPRNTATNKKQRKICKIFAVAQMFFMRSYFFETYKFPS